MERRTHARIYSTMSRSAFPGTHTAPGHCMTFHQAAVKLKQATHRHLVRHLHYDSPSRLTSIWSPSTPPLLGGPSKTNILARNL